MSSPKKRSDETLVYIISKENLKNLIFIKMWMCCLCIQYEAQNTKSHKN